MGRNLLKCVYFLIPLCLLLVQTGCEHSDESGTDDYFAANSYSSAQRDDPLDPQMLITPLSVGVDIINQEVLFTVSGGEGSYRWHVSNSGNGIINSHGANQAVYICKQVGNNTVTVQDEVGHYVVAQVTPVADAMTITPSTVTLSEGALYASFSVSGGTAPYVWSVGNVGLGTISYSAGTSYIVSYTAVVAAAGKNTVTVRDAEGRTATAEVTQTASESE